MCASQDATDLLSVRLSRRQALRGGISAQRHHGCAVGQRGPRVCGGGDDWAPSVTPLKLGFTDLKTVFVNVQHPGDEGALAAMSSNWPSSQAAAASGRRPRPSTIVVTHKDGGDVGV